MAKCDSFLFSHMNPHCPASSCAGQPFVMSQSTLLPHTGTSPRLVRASTRLNALIAAEARNCGCNVGPFPSLKGFCQISSQSVFLTRQRKLLIIFVKSSVMTAEAFVNTVFSPCSLWDDIYAVCPAEGKAARINAETFRLLTGVSLLPASFSTCHRSGSNSCQTFQDTP